MKLQWERLAVKALGARPAVLTVRAVESAGPQFRRIQVDCGDLFSRVPIHPTMWLRLWFDNQGKPHQRAFTLVDPDPQTHTAWLEFALHGGIAADWARQATIGQSIEASFLGSKYSWDGDAPAAGSAWETTLIAGDLAALPAINSLLDHLGDTPATVVLDCSHHKDQAIAVRCAPAHQLRYCHGSAAFTDEVLAQVSGAGQRVWIAAEAELTRTLAKRVQQDYGVAKNDIAAVGYWRMG
ncbi:MAG: siderophore-interacting protein [Propionibacteriaceae bacterium]